MSEEEFEKELKINDENWHKEIERLREVDQEEIRLLKNKIDKAIEFIKENTKVIPFNEIGEGGGLELTDYDIPKLLELLGGDE